jgi:hypothetical protein
MTLPFDDPSLDRQVTDAAHARVLAVQAVWRGDVADRPERCTSCRQKILWAVTDRNAEPIPINPQAISTGNVSLDLWGDAVVATVNPPAGAPGDRYRSHFVTCPNADRHRKPR